MTVLGMPNSRVSGVQRGRRGEDPEHKLCLTWCASAASGALGMILPCAFRWMRLLGRPAAVPGLAVSTCTYDEEVHQPECPAYDKNQAQAVRPWEHVHPFEAEQNAGYEHSQRDEGSQRFRHEVASRFVLTWCASAEAERFSSAVYLAAFCWMRLLDG